MITQHLPLLMCRVWMDKQAYIIIEEEERVLWKNKSFLKDVYGDTDFLPFMADRFPIRVETF